MKLMLKEDSQAQRGARVCPLGDFTKAPGNTSFSVSFPPAVRGEGPGPGDVREFSEDGEEVSLFLFV